MYPASVRLAIRYAQIHFPGLRFTAIAVNVAASEAEAQPVWVVEVLCLIMLVPGRWHMSCHVPCQVYGKSHPRQGSTLPPCRILAGVNQARVQIA